MASLESPSWSGPAETIVKILHIYPVPRVLEIWQSAALTYKKANPAVKIESDYLENEEFKAKLPTLLQSNDCPSLFHSWGGGVMREQIQAGVCQDITNAIDEDFKDSFYPAGVQAFIVGGKSYGLPDSVGPIVFWYNKELCDEPVPPAVIPAVVPMPPPRSIVTSKSIAIVARVVAVARITIIAAVPRII